MVQVERITYLDGYHDVVVAFGEVVVFRTGAHEDAVLAEIIAGGDADTHVVGVTRVLIADVPFEQEAVAKEVAALQVESHAETLVGTVRKAEA